MLKPRIKAPEIGISQMTGFVIGQNQQGQTVTCVFGLGADGRLYEWSHFEGQWIENWLDDASREAAKKELAKQGAYGPKGQNGKVTHSRKKRK